MDFITTLEVLSQPGARVCSPARPSKWCGLEQLEQIKFDEKKQRITIWVKMIIISISSYFWICNFGYYEKIYSPLFYQVFFQDIETFFPTVLFFISKQFITRYFCSLLFVTAKSCSDINVQQMGMRQNILAI